MLPPRQECARILGRKKSLTMTAVSYIIPERKGDLFVQS
jgi:hypothetical protein